uniref:Uncharacterized protein n=1 Tax=Plectus sambesii TaxID=2011161 RepID=A0A914VH97_9BILA
MAEQQMNGETSVMKKYPGDNICRVACYFTTMPDTDDRDIVSDFDGNTFYILDNETLKIKGEMKLIGGWYKEKIGSPDSLIITPQLVAITVPARFGRNSLIFFQYSVNMDTGRSFVMSFLVEKRKRVRLIDQIELPINNKPGNYGYSANLGGDGWYYISFTWLLHDNKGDNTVLNLARVSADRNAKIKCEKLASERLIPGIWLASLVKSGYLWFLTPKQILKHSFDGKISEVFELNSHNGQYPPPWGIEIIDYDNYLIAHFRHGLQRSIWAMNFLTRRWINLHISYAMGFPCGITGNAITPAGIVYLLGQTWSEADSQNVGVVQIHHFDAQKRLKQILDQDQATIANASTLPSTPLPTHTVSPTFLPLSSAQDELEADGKTSSYTADEEESMTYMPRKRFWRPSPFSMN